MPGMAKPVPKAKDSPRAGCCFGGFFILIALPFLGYFCWQGYSDFRCFTQYQPATCKILGKRMLTSSGKNGTTYRPEFTFEFVDEHGRKIEARGYDNWDVYSSGYSGKKKVLDSYQVGQTCECWYDPKDPGRAVLVRRVSWMYLFALIPFLFVLVGAAIVRHSLRSGGRGASPESRAFKERGFKKGKKEEKPLTTRPGRVLALALSPENANEPGIGCLIFAAVLAASGVVVYMEWAKSLWGLALALFVLGLIGTVITIMSLANRRRLRKVQVEVNAAKLIPGQKLECWVSISGQTEMNSLTIRLVCEERATYRQGTSTRVDKRKVVDEQLAEETTIKIDPLEPFELRGATRVPEDAMHTFKADRNEIAWFLQVDCDIPRWPDSHYSYPLKVAARRDPGVHDPEDA